jgi:hypothetical protein
VLALSAIGATAALVLHQKLLGARQERAAEAAARAEEQIRLAVELDPQRELETAGTGMSSRAASAANAVKIPQAAFVSVLRTEDEDDG